MRVVIIALEVEDTDVKEMINARDVMIDTKTVVTEEIEADTEKVKKELMIQECQGSILLYLIVEYL